ncbi:hypothetical protein DH2020_008551 [Rehmannia glutinosa]|uniref:Glycosyltransferase n=1 Tax=Rehmannia glutinosa TaxID=99300 RepID=A0ABR0X3R5_REHGL
MAPGHMIPLVDMARQFARHDTVTVKATIILSNLNAPQFRATIERDKQQGFDISIRQVTFPSAQLGLPEDFGRSLSSATNLVELMKFVKAISMLKQPVEDLLREDRPDCIVSDFLITWTVDLAAKLGIPRLAFHVCGFFPLSVHHSLTKHKPDSDPFVVPGLPDAVMMTRRQVPDGVLACGENAEDYDDYEVAAKSIVENAAEKEVASFGVVVNSFKELEPAYVEHYRRIIGRKAWQVGPVALCNKDTVDKAQRGNNDDDNNNNNYYLDNWLSAKEPNSVVYVCFGTMTLFSATQLREIAIGLESCGQPFIWVVPANNDDQEWLPEGFEERINNEGKGLMIKGWAPQVLILEHESVGGFLTHCGWNSLLEGVIAGKPMITWPISAEQFSNEKLVTDILKIGVSVGNLEWTRTIDVYKGSITGKNIAKAVNKVMDVGAEEAMEMRKRAKALSDEAKKAVQRGGSSYNDLDSLLQELMQVKKM